MADTLMRHSRVVARPTASGPAGSERRLHEYTSLSRKFPRRYWTAASNLKRLVL